MNRLVSLLLCTLSLTCLALPARADTIWVGNTSSDTACDASNLANAMLIAAFNGTPSDTIRISNEGGGTSGSYLDTNAVLEGNDILVQGGYADCSGTPGSNAVLDGTGSPAAPVVKITCSSSGCATRHTFTLRKLVLKNGEAGGVDVSGNVHVNMDGVTLIQNSNTNGGALHVDATQNAVVNLYGLSTLRNSSASASGGGIYCSGFPSGGSAFQVFMTDALIYQNDAVDGGGVYLTNGCRMRDQATSTLDGLNVNTASGNGGGVAVMGGAHFELTGSGAAPAVILSNQAAQGGGVYVEGSGSVFAAIESHVDSNTSSGSGGGLFVTDQGLATVIRGAALGTCKRTACVSISNNTAVGGNGGGAGYVRSLGTIRIRGAYIRFNQARYGSAFDVSSYGGGANYGNLELSSAVVANNYGSLGTIDAYQSPVSIDGTTFYANSGPTSGPSAAFTAARYVSTAMAVCPPASASAAAYSTTALAPGLRLAPAAPSMPSASLRSMQADR